MQVVEPAPLSRKERERLSRRNAMLEAAQSVFAEKGFGPASLDEIASRAEFGKGTIYNYFPGGKEEILFALLDQFYDGLIEVIEGHSPTGGDAPVRERFRVFLSQMFAFLEQRDDLFLIGVKESHRHLFGDDADKAAYFHGRRDLVVSALARPLKEAMDRGEIKHMPPVAAAHMLLGNVQGCYTHVCLCQRYGTETGDTLGSAEQNAEFLTAMLFDGLLTKD